MECINCNNKTSNKYCSRECCSEFKRMRKQNLGKDGEMYLRIYDKVPTPNELKQYLEERVKKYKWD